MKLTIEEATEVIYGEHPDWIGLSETREMEDGGRWSNIITQIFKHVPTGKHYQFNWEEGGTEMQEDTPPFGYGDPDICLVEYQKVTKMEWVLVVEDDED